jgi:thiol-disulfide isomerase/thioredoxin
MRRRHSLVLLLALVPVVLGLAARAGAADGPRPFVPGSRQAIVAAHAGQAFILGLWSLECTHCRDDLALLGRVAARHPDLPVVLVSTDTPQDADTVRATLQSYDLQRAESWVYSTDDPDRLRFDIDRHWYGELPRTYLYDADGSVHAYSGTLDERLLAAWLGARAGARP